MVEEMVILPSGPGGLLSPIVPVPPDLGSVFGPGSIKNNIRNHVLLPVYIDKIISF